MEKFKCLLTVCCDNGCESSYGRISTYEQESQGTLDAMKKSLRGHKRMFDAIEKSQLLNSQKCKFWLGGIKVVAQTIVPMGREIEVENELWALAKEIATERLELKKHKWLFEDYRLLGRQMWLR
ncbi:hypothetical protein A3G50_00925 [Candidatus Jorgensenbacteria bacterium RIFCSPLOWO2_12_FULL_42_11]|uniref:Uncharacterized protein n=1 Tax=Candidatus Jorgensenbacteria bacterium RIFCSPLOWO2_12_FULL_42_11 TaxID=1798473 RepID=A0A1F6C3I7_9BACT|nr:MAG: hypothetical protein A3G50_00925 [Candidatus Jorgensenbacteria bacterium RIFCSPLOWO2_12_FULL_42_11]